MLNFDEIGDEAVWVFIGGEERERERVGVSSTVALTCLLVDSIKESREKRLNLN